MTILNNTRSVIKNNKIYLIVPDDKFSEYNEIANESLSYLKVIPSTIFHTMSEYLVSNTEFQNSKERWTKRDTIHDTNEFYDFCKKVVEEYSQIIPFYHKDFQNKQVLSWIIEDCANILA